MFSQQLNSSFRLVLGLFLSLPVVVLGQKNIEIEDRFSNGKIEIKATLPKDITMATVKIYSNRNYQISKITDISPLHPEPSKVLPSVLPNKEIYYPVVDLRINAGMNAEISLNQVPSKWILNAHLYKEIFPNQQHINLPVNQLEDWENSFYVEPASVQINTFSFNQKVAVIDGQLRFIFEPLVDHWSGKVELVYHHNYQLIHISKEINYKVDVPISTVSNPDKVKNALSQSVQYLLRAQNKNQNSPMYGSLNLFYDIEAKTYRSNHWLWGAGPAIKVLLDVAKRNDLNLGLTASELTSRAEEIGRAGLSNRNLDLNSPVYGVPISRWRRDIILPDNGYQFCLSTSDANFLSGWGWLPLYEATQKKEYLEAAKLLAATTDTLMNKYGLIPQDFYFDENKFSEQTIDESGFGAEGLSKLYEVTGNPYYKSLTDRYMKEHLKKLSRPDGLWERGWHKTKGVQTTIKMTRGLGWAMEGLLATHRAIPEGPYLDLAKKMADQLLVWQNSKGYWAFIADESIEKTGISEKGTALWSYLMYQLYRETRQEKYLLSARKALNWCIENQYNGPDPLAKGGIIGLTVHSAVGSAFRPWYPITCAYTSAFFALACLEELKWNL